MRVAERITVAFLQTIAARNAARIVNGMVCSIDTSRLATAFAEVATIAFIGINTHFEPRETRQKTEHSAHRADGVAVGAPIAPSENEQHYKGGQRDTESNPTAHPDFFVIDGVTVHALGEIGDAVVCPVVERCNQVLHHTSVGTIRCQKCHERAHARYHRHNEKCQHGIAQP